MNDLQIPIEQLQLLCYMSDFGNTHVEDLLPKGLVKYGLNKMRWVLTDFGITHYYLPEMPIADYIMMAASLDEQITDGDVLSETVFYTILAARNILRLLCRAYEYNDAVNSYYDLPISVVFDTVKKDNLFQCPSSDMLLRDFSLFPEDNIKKVTDVLLTRIEHITSLCPSKADIMQKLIAGTDEEQRILSAYWLYHLLFPVFISLLLPLDFSAEVLNPKYRTHTFQDGYNNDFTNVVRKWRERSAVQ